MISLRDVVYAPTQRSCVGRKANSTHQQERTQVRFIDLFAGLGGFHLALAHLGHECVFASEIDTALRDNYEKNYGMAAVGDIRLTSGDVPPHDVLCAGFPCQPFSKAGSQDGFEHATNGALFHEILKIIDRHHPEFVLLENVANFERHDGGNTWRVAEGTLRQAGYDVDLRKLSPHEFGVPQIRERVFIVGRRRSLGSFRWPAKELSPTSIETVLDESPREARQIPENLTRAISVWQEFLDRFPRDEELPSFPIWSQEFGATYPLDGIDPTRMKLKDLARARGIRGESLHSVKRWSQAWEMLPSYAAFAEYPRWKRLFLAQNRALYDRNRDWIDKWKGALEGLPASFQKLEWNCKGEERDLSRYILQARPSGIRVKRSNWAPALVAQTTTQLPIIGWEQRYVTVRECMRLQSMDDLRSMPPTDSIAYAALGNAVNVEVVRRISEALLDPASVISDDPVGPASQLGKEGVPA